MKSINCLNKLKLKNVITPYGVITDVVLHAKKTGTFKELKNYNKGTAYEITNY